MSYWQIISIIKPAVQTIVALHMEKTSSLYTMKIDTLIDELADMLSTVIEGDIILSRTLAEQKILAQQILQYRNFLRLLFNNI